MRQIYIIFTLIAYLFECNFVVKAMKGPNIVFILADDAGWNDFSFHGSPQIPTPNIDALCFGGIALNNYYSSPMCTPSRGATLTGKHPIHIGLQHYVITGGMPEGLPLQEKTLPEFLKTLNYSTHLIGKWHLGHSSKYYTPIFRGFDTHLGYWLGKQDYYTHFTQDAEAYGYDFRSNLEVLKSVFGKYNTDIFTEEAIEIINKHNNANNPLFLMINHIAPHSGNFIPLQAPLQNIKKFESSISDLSRRKFAGMIDKLDESVAQVITALQKNNLLKETIIVFASDNGGAPEGFDSNYGSNWPLRGAKNTLWEGGTRLASCLWSPQVNSRVYKGLMHAQDWLPTLYEAAGGHLEDLPPIDGVSFWKTFTGFENPEENPRTGFLYNIDDIYNNSAIREGAWKLVQGNTSTYDLGGGNWDKWYGPSGMENSTRHYNIPKSAYQSEVGKHILQASGRTIPEKRFEEAFKKVKVSCESKVLIECNPYQKPCLFNIEEDPCELTNLADQYPEKIRTLLDKLRLYNSTAKTPIPRIWDPRADPKNWGYIWNNWLDYSS